MSLYLFYTQRAAKNGKFWGTNFFLSWSHIKKAPKSVSAFQYSRTVMRQRRRRERVDVRVGRHTLSGENTRKCLDASKLFRLLASYNCQTRTLKEKNNGSDILSGYFSRRTLEAINTY